MSEPNLEKLDRLRKRQHQLKESSESINADVFVIGDKIRDLEGSRPGKERYGEEMGPLNQEIANLKEKKAEVHRQYSQAINDFNSITELLNKSVEWLEGQGIPIPPETQSGRSFSFYRR